MGRFFERLKQAKNDKVKWSECNGFRERFIWVISRVLAALVSIAVAILIFSLIALCVTSIRGCATKKAEASQEPITYADSVYRYYDSGTYISMISTNNIYVRPLKFRFPMNYSSYSSNSRYFAYTYQDNLSDNDWYYTSYDLNSLGNLWKGLPFMAETTSGSLTQFYVYFWQDITDSSSDNLKCVFAFSGIDQFMSYSYDSQNHISSVTWDNTKELYCTEFSYRYMDSSMIDYYNDTISYTITPFDNTVVNVRDYFRLDNTLSYACLTWKLNIDIDHYASFNAYIPVVFDVNALGVPYTGNLDYFINPVLMTESIGYLSSGDDYYQAGWRDGSDYGYEQGRRENVSQQYDEGYADGYSDGDEVGYNRGINERLEDLTPWRCIVQGVNSFLTIEIFPEFPLYIPLLISFGIIMLVTLFKVFFHG